MLNTDDIPQLVKALAQKAISKELRVATAESCTGGGIAYAITELEGSSAWFEGGIVSYSNSVKTELLGVKQSTLDQVGAVSEAVALEMVNAIQLKTNAEICVSVTGIAGPSGGTKSKPVGTVWIAWKNRSESPQAELFLFSGNRFEVREKAILEALNGLISRV